MKGRREGRHPPGDRGQATVELALLLPVLVGLLAALVQAGVLVRDQILVTHAAREAVRAAALEDDPEVVERAAAAAGPLDPDRLEVAIAGRGGPGSRVTVRITYRTPTRTPLVGRIVGDVTLRASATMRVEH